MTANASIVLDRREDVLLAPNWAVRRDRQNGKTYLTAARPARDASEVEVKTGLRNDTFSEILSGADEGQVVPRASCWTVERAGPNDTDTDTYLNAHD